MIPPVRGRTAFAELRRHGRRARAGAIRITFHADASPSPRLAFAVSRRLGTAVVRNRVRRRLRVLMATLRAERPDLVPAGDYLVAVHQADFTDEEARQWLTEALQALHQPMSPTSTPGSA